MTDQLLAVPVDELVPSPFNRPVINDEYLKELTASIAANGVLQALTVRPLPLTGGQRYQIVIGEHRWRAAVKAKLETVPCRVVTATDTDVVLLQLQENLNRKDPNALEVGASYLRLSKLGLKPDEIAKRSGKSLAYVYAHLSLNKASDVLRKAVLDGRITGSHAARLVTLPVDVQETWIDDIQYDHLSVRDLEKDLARDYAALSSAPWKQNDAILDKKAGPCSVCPKSTSVNEDIRVRLGVKAGLCTDGACFQHKLDLYIDRTIAEYKSRGITLVKLTEKYNFRPATKKDPAKKVITAIDVKTGKVGKWVDTRIKPRKSAKSAGLSYEERTRQSKARAKQETAWRTRVYDELKKKIPKTPGPVELQVIEASLRHLGKATGTIGQRVVQLAIKDEVRVPYYNIRPATHLCMLAKRYKINVKKIQGELSSKALNDPLGFRKKKGKKA